MNKICPAYGIQMGTILGEIFCTFHKDGCIFGRSFLYISAKWVHFSGKNVCTLGHKFVPEPSMTLKIHREPSPGHNLSGIAQQMAPTTGIVQQMATTTGLQDLLRVQGNSHNRKIHGRHSALNAMQHTDMGCTLTPFVESAGGKAM